MKKTSVALVGAGGYGGDYLEYLLESPASAALAAVADPFPPKPVYQAALADRGIPVYEDLQALLAAHSVDLVIISSPVGAHERQVLCALGRGAHVLCEKPLAPTLQAAHRILAAAKGTGRLVGVGFQWSFTAAMQAMKADLARGLFGRPVLLKTMLSWPRYDSYYARGGWKGRLRDENGEWLLDGIAGNAGAHYLHNLFFVMGGAPGAALLPANAEAGLYRCKDIQSYDTCFVRGSFPGGGSFYYAATHAGLDSIDPVLEYRFEDAVVRLEPDGPLGRLVAEANSGARKDYGVVTGPPSLAEKVEGMLGAVRGTAPLASPVESTLPHLALTNAMLDYAPIANFPAHLCVATQQPGGRFVQSLAGEMRQCFATAQMPTQAGLAWAAPGTQLPLAGYSHFEGRLLL